MELSGNGVAVVGVICYLSGAISSTIFQVMYWMLKVRKDVNAAHEAIRQIRKVKRGV